MSVQSMTAVISRSRAKGSELLVLLLLANHASGEDHSTWVSAATLATEARMSERQVRRILKRLSTEEGGLGEIDIQQRPGRTPVIRLLLKDPGHLVQGQDVRTTASGGSQVSPTPDTAVSVTPDTAVSDEPSEPSGTVRTAPPERSQTPSGSSISLLPQGVSDPPDRLDASFGEFWQVYPRKVGKRAARAAFERAARRASVEEILDGARRFAADPNLPETRFIPHPTTWLNQDRWADEPLPPRTDARRGDPGGRNRAFTLLEEAARLREQRLGRAGDRPAPPAQLASGGAP
jgi:hypothetical protein